MLFKTARFLWKIARHVSLIVGVMCVPPTSNEGTHTWIDRTTEKSVRGNAKPPTPDRSLYCCRQVYHFHNSGVSRTTCVIVGFCVLVLDAFSFEDTVKQRSKKEPPHNRDGTPCGELAVPYIDFIRSCARSSALCPPRVHVTHVHDASQGSI